MLVAERYATGSVLANETDQVGMISMATVSAVAAVLLVYVSGTFQLADLFGGKRLVQVLLVLPIAAGAAYYLVASPARLTHPLILFSVARLGTELALRGQLSYILDSVCAILGLTVLLSVPRRSFATAANVVVSTSGVLALLALIQMVILAASPQLDVYVLGPVDEGEVQSPIEHPIALLGLGMPNRYTLGSFEIGRMQSFAKEPSLNVVYFMLPASLALLRGSLASLAWGCIMTVYCVLSLSGSVFLACAFAVLWAAALTVVSVRVVMPYAILAAMAAYIFAFQYFGAVSALQAFDYISQFGDFLSKSASVRDRGAGAILNMTNALRSPLGSASIAEVPGPWLVNSALAAGWLGVMCLVSFLIKLGRELDSFYARCPRLGAGKAGSLLLIGALASVLIFNDYQMGNYVGIVLLAVIYRTLQLANQEREAA